MSNDKGEVIQSVELLPFVVYIEERGFKKGNEVSCYKNTRLFGTLNSP